MSTPDLPAVRGTSMTAQRCWALLRETEVGRLAVVVERAPDIFPVNFVVDHGSLVIRTAAGSKLAAATSGAPVAFEVDGYDPAAGEAWSVVVKGQVELVRTIQQAVATVGLPLFPWHAAPKPCFLRVVPDEVTGRRFVVVAPTYWDRRAATCTSRPACCTTCTTRATAARCSTSSPADLAGPPAPDCPATGRSSPRSR